MVQITVELKTGKLTDKLSKGKEIQRLGLDYTTQGLISALMQNSPVDHGLLKQWFVASMTDDEATIKSPAIYANAQNYGSSHMIMPKNKKALHWGGDPGFFSKGHMVNIKGKHFVETSIEQVQPQIPGFFLKAFHEVMD